MAVLRSAHHTKADLDRIPDDERTFYLMAGQLANDINILGRLLSFAASTPRPDTPRMWAGLTQMLLIAKLLAARLFEGHRLISQTFSARKLRAKYLDDLPPKAIENLDKINRYFGSENLIERVRNKFANHFDVEQIEALYEQLPPEADFVDLVSDEYRGHTLFYGAEVLSFHAMAEAVGEPNALAAIHKLMKETINMSVLMGEFIGPFIQLMWERYLVFTPAKIKKIKITSDGPINSYSLPMFCAPPKR
jgi:hypothetical protein